MGKMKSLPKRNDTDRLLQARAAIAEYKARCEQLEAERAAIQRHAALLKRELNVAIRDSQQIIASILRARSCRAATLDARRVAESARVRAFAVGAVFSQNDIASLDDRIDVAPVLDRVAREVATLYGRRGVGLRVTGDETTVTVRDAQHLALVATELTMNAYEHAFTGRPFGMIEVGVRPDRSHGGHLWVADNGIGCDPRRVNRFEGSGWGLVRALAGGLDAALDYEDTRPGLKVDLRFRAAGVAPQRQLFQEAAW